jgi:hypothetical protein
MIEIPDESEAMTRLQSNYPYLTYVQYRDRGLLGIVQNETSQFLMLYNLQDIRDARMKMVFLEYGNEWWFESNNEVPIDSFLGRKFDVFRPYLKGYPKKEIVRVVGPRINLSEIYSKRIKKRKVELVRPMPKAPD